MVPVPLLRYGDPEAADLPGRLIRRKMVHADRPASVVIAALVSPPQKATVCPAMAAPPVG